MAGGFGVLGVPGLEFGVLGGPGGPFWGPGGSQKAKKGGPGGPGGLTKYMVIREGMSHGSDMNPSIMVIFVPR